MNHIFIENAAIKYTWCIILNMDSSEYLNFLLFLLWVWIDVFLQNNPAYKTGFTTIGFMLSRFEKQVILTNNSYKYLYQTIKLWIFFDKYLNTLSTIRLKMFFSVKKSNKSLLLKNIKIWTKTINLDNSCFFLCFLL